jgi:hypothetical protein
MKDVVLIRRWIAALRSGGYKQCMGRLYDGSGYCCIGVLTQLSGLRLDLLLDTEEKQQMSMPRYLAGKEYESWLAQRTGFSGGWELADYACGGGSAVVPSRRDVKYPEQLSAMNDSGLTFSQIADMIEWWNHDVLYPKEAENAST